MRSFGRLAISFFVLGLLIFAFAYMFMPKARDTFHDPENPVGQLKSSDTLVSPGQAADLPAQRPAPESSDE
jgi:hypothetical protein